LAETVRAAWLQAQQHIAQTLNLKTGEAKLEAQVLLQAALNKDRAWLLSHETDALSANIHAALQTLLKRRLNGEPIAYILGKREFYGLEFSVTPDTLIPRPDTETLVEAALEKIPLERHCHVLDLGAGTGAIAIALASQRPLAKVIGVDVSEAAVGVARANAKSLDIKNVEFVLSDWFTELQGRTFDVIVSNPPYIAANDPHLEQGDLRFEPIAALAAGEDGLDCIRNIIGKAGPYLKPQGWLMFEHGYDQAEKVAQLMRDEHFDMVTSIADLPGILRVTLGRAAINL
jgi:release factor glutamine methyltransferase